MKKALSAIFAIGILAATYTDAYCNDYGIIPEPASITGAEGRFKLKGASINAKGEQAEKVASILSSKIQEASGITLAVGRMEQILAKYGKKLVGWDEILEGGLSPNATVMSWQGEKGKAVFTHPDN